MHLTFSVVICFIQHFGFRPHFVPGPRPARVEGCAATRRVLEAAVSPAPWTHPLQAQVGPFRQSASWQEFITQSLPQTVPSLISSFLFSFELKLAFLTMQKQAKKK